MAAFKFDWTIADAPKSAGVLAHGRMYHATQASNVPSILESGLRTGGASQGILTRLDSRYRHHWSDDFYGMRPIYLLLEPVIPRMYGWPDSENGGDEEPVILEVDTSDVRLLPDLPTFEIPYFAFAGPRGVHWYDHKRGMSNVPIPRRYLLPSFRSLTTSVSCRTRSLPPSLHASRSTSPRPPQRWLRSRLPRSRCVSNSW
jgi:hypothetical protein